MMIAADELVSQKVIQKKGNDLTVRTSELL